MTEVWHIVDETETKDHQTKQLLPILLRSVLWVLRLNFTVLQLVWFICICLKIQELASLGLDRLKSALVALGLKCGGYVTNTLDIVSKTFPGFEGCISSCRVPGANKHTLGEGSEVSRCSVHMEWSATAHYVYTVAACFSQSFQDTSLSVHSFLVRCAWELTLSVLDT